LIKAFDKVYAASQKFNASMRIAAYIVAINKVAQTYKNRGSYKAHF
jgi:glutamate dehydrogenase (NAD(P)+)